MACKSFQRIPVRCKILGLLKVTLHLNVFDKVDFLRVSKVGIKY